MRNDDDSRDDGMAESNPEDRRVGIYAPDPVADSFGPPQNMINHLAKQTTTSDNIKRLNLALVEPNTAQPRHEHMFGANYSSELTDKSTRLSL